MPISNLTAMIIASHDDLVITATGPAMGTEDHPEWNGKYLGWITLGKEDRYRPLLNSDPYYDTAEDAVVAMKKIVEEVKANPLPA